jgi:hypothetical protein
MITLVPFLIGGFLVVALVLLSFYLSKLKNDGKNRKKILLYLLVFGILIGLTFLIRFSVVIFIAANIWLLGVGILHVWLQEKYFPEGSGIWGNILFTLALFFFGNVIFLLLYKFFISTPFQLVFLSPGLCFLVPMITVIAFDKFTDIPVSLFKLWNFPQPGSLSDPTDSEMADPLIINFEIRKRTDDNLTVFKAKAPKGLQLGRLFYYFIMDYNSRYPDNPVVLSESEGSYFKWSFFMTGSVFSGKTYPDPDLTISDNKIKENSSITCERILS